MTTADKYLHELADLLHTMPRESMERIIGLLQEARTTGRHIFIFGNGGSAANASHFAVDVLKGTLDPAKPRYKVLCLNDNIPTLTALANDMGYDVVFSEQLLSLAAAGDIAIGISCSGNSPNILRAIEAAQRLRVATIGLTGDMGGKLKDMVDVPLIVPSRSMQLVEDAHRVLLHAIFVELCA